MKSKFSFFCALMGLFSLSIFGQSSEVENTCSTPANSPNFHQMDNLRIPDNSGNKYYLKIYVHVLTHTDYGPGQSILGINESLKRLYSDFDPIGIHFIWDGNVDYVVNNTWYTNPSSDIFNIMSFNNHSDGIDIYLGSDTSLDDAAFAYGIGGETSFLISGFRGIASEDNFTFLSKSSTMAHEMGHVLFLWHTFHGTNPDDNLGDPNANPECLNPPYIDGNGVTHNPWYSGDYIFDTPPDPGTDFGTNCNYFGGEQDVCGSDFDPLTNNFMSGALDHCRVSFTLGQIRRMKNAIAILPQLQNAQLQDYAYIRGKNIVCIYEDPFIITSNSTSNLTIENSSNIDIALTPISSTQINVSVTNLDPVDDEGEVAWIVAKRNGVEIGRKNFWIGKPQAMTFNSISGNQNVSSNDIEEYYLPARLEGTEAHLWDIPGYESLEQEPFILNLDPWQYDYTTKHHNILKTMIGVCEGELFAYGLNECGDGTNSIPPSGNGLDINVANPSPSCPAGDTPSPIVYYPNPASSLLEVDLSLQEYQVFTVTIYDENQTVHYNDQSTNIVKTVDVAGLSNGTYYLHIYDGDTTLLLSAILIINH